MSAYGTVPELAKGWLVEAMLRWGEDPTLALVGRAGSVYGILRL